jgi:hypothetical protein
MTTAHGLAGLPRNMGLGLLPIGRGGIRFKGFSTSLTDPGVMSEHAVLPSPELRAFDQATATARGPGGWLAFESDPPPHPASATADAPATTDAQAMTLKLARPRRPRSPTCRVSHRDDTQSAALRGEA